MLNTILGSFSSGVAPVTTSYESIATVTVGSGGAADVTFSSIPSTFTHLQIRLICRDTGAFTERTLFMEYNGNSPTGSNAIHSLRGDGSTTFARNAINQGKYESIIKIPAASATSNVFSAQIIDILDYANTNKTKVTRILTGYDLNGSGSVGVESYLFNTTSAITSIKLYPNNNFVQYSQIALYGIKGA